MKLAFVINEEFIETNVEYNDFDCSLTHFVSHVSKLLTHFENKSMKGYMDRNLCETDGAYQQIIPYIILKDKNTGHFFCYTRGELGDEERLHGVCSIGIGGHIDQEYPGANFLELVEKEAVREIEEEIGYSFSEEELDAIRKTIARDAFLIKSDNDEVSSVHTAVCFTIEIDPDKITKLEEGVITKGIWINPEELYTLGDELPFKLELWSKLALNNIYSE